MKRYLMLGLGVLGVSFLMGCQYRYFHVFEKKSELIGTWLVKGDQETQTRAVFRQDGIFEIMGEKSFKGMYEIRYGGVRLEDLRPGVDSDCLEPGYYSYRVEDGLLKFKETGDACLSRKKILLSPMVQMIPEGKNPGDDRDEDFNCNFENCTR